MLPVPVVVFTALVSQSTLLEASANARRTPVVRVVEQAGPAIVNISAEPARRGGAFGRSAESERFFEEFFGRRAPRRGSRKKQQSMGSGVIIDSSGLILTNEHVVSGMSNITITLADRRTFEVEVIGADPDFDLAVLKARTEESLPAVRLGTSTDLMAGEPVVAIGNPFGLANTVTTGVVSALHRSISAGDRRYEDFVQTDAAINPGNSGGALLNIEGHLIGINTAIYKSGRGIGFAIPIDKAKAVVDEVLRYGEVRPIFLGVQCSPQGRDAAYVTRVYPESPAATAGLKRGDRIVDIGGQEVRDCRAFRAIERASVAGQKLQIKIERGARKPVAHSLEVVCREMSLEIASKIGKERLGLSVKEDRGRLRITGVRGGTAARKVGIRAGDLLLAIGGRRLTNRAEFEKWSMAVWSVSALSVVIGRAGRAYSVTLELER